MYGLLPLLGAIGLMGLALLGAGEAISRRPTIHDLEQALAASTGQTGFGNTGAVPAHQVFIEMEPRDVPDHLLLAVLIAGSTGQRNPTEVALDLMHRAAGDLVNLTQIDIVRETPGMGPSGRARLLAAAEFARRMEYRTRVPKKAISTAEDAVEIIRPMVTGPYEKLIGIYLDRRRRVLGTRHLTTGSDAFTVVDPRQVLRPALELGAAAVILAHNHPSGDATPSAMDREVTHRVAKAGYVLGIPLLDHIVVGRRGGWTSLAEQGEIPRRTSSAIVGTY